MSQLVNRSGQCLCGSISFTAAQVNPYVGACHCTMCRQWGSGPYRSAECGNRIAFERESLAVYASSKWAERGFFRRCGTHSVYRLRDNQTHCVPVGLLDTEDQVTLDHQMFIDEKPSYDPFTGDSKTLTGEALFAVLGSTQNESVSFATHSEGIA